MKKMNAMSGCFFFDDYDYYARGFIFLRENIQHCGNIVACPYGKYCAIFCSLYLFLSILSEGSRQGEGGVKGASE